MIYLKPNRKKLAGFSLVELAIVLLITTIILSAGLSLLSVTRAASQREATQKKQEAIKQALINYLGQNKRLPCPAVISTTAPYTTGAESRTSGNPCTQYSGIVPYQELGLDQAAVLDGWENFITYVVSPPNVYITQPVAPAPLLSTAWLYTYNTVTPSNVSPFTMTTITNPVNTNPSPAVTITATDSAFWPSSSTGGIIVAQTMGGTTTPVTPLIADPTKATGAAVVLISYGKNGYGAFNIKGGINLPLPAANTDELQNATLPAVATQPTVIKRDATDSPTLRVGGATVNTGAFDDIVMPLSANDLTGPLIANGTLQPSAQAALNQANDAVIGNIIISRVCNPTASCTQTTLTSPVCTNYAPGTSCIAYDTAVPPNCISYAPVCTNWTTGSSGCSQYTSACTYSIPANIILTSPSNVAAWGVSYARATGLTNISASTPSGTAYTLTAGDGSSKLVSIQELQGILTRGAGFN